MERKEFMSTYLRCVEKADLKYSWWLSEDIDEDAEIFLDENGCLYIKDIKTSYTYHDAVKIKYRQNEEDDFNDQDYYIAIWFSNGDYLRIGMSDYRDYIDLMIREDGKFYHQDKVYDYWKSLMVKEG